MSEPPETPEKADSESRCSTPHAASITSLDFDESSKSERRTRSSRSSTPVTKALRPRQKVSESPSSNHDGDKFDDDDDDTMDEGPLVEKRKNAEVGQVIHDAYCWICHKELLDSNNCKECSTCVRSFHPKCSPTPRPAQSTSKSEDWQCPECSPFVYEPAPRSEGTQEQLDVLFKYLIDRAVGQSSEPFMNPVDLKEFPQYLDYIVHPVCISQIEEKLSKQQYGNPRDLLTDFKWIYHNSVIFNSPQAKLTSIAKQMLRVVREETKEIESCPNCLYNAYSMQPDWFIQACDRPHLLVWAKMKGFPYWPAKAMSFNQAKTLVDVRFFGKHDRAYLPIVDCMLYTSWYPAPAQVKKPREDVATCIKEVDQHIEKLKEKFGSFVYASNITFLNPKDMEGQVKKMLPNYKPEDVGKKQNTSTKSTLDNSIPANMKSFKPSVVLTRISDPKVSTPQGSPVHIVKSEPISIKVSSDEESSESISSGKTKSKDAAKQPSVNTSIPAKSPKATAGVNDSTKPPLKQKIGPASKMAGRNLSLQINERLKQSVSPGLSKTTATGPTQGVKSSDAPSPKKGNVNLAKELEALNSDLSDSDDDIDNFIEDDEAITIPAKKLKLDAADLVRKSDKSTSEKLPQIKKEKLDLEGSTSSNDVPPKEGDATSKSNKPVVSKEKQRKIAEGMKALDNLKIYGLDVVPVPHESTSPVSASYVDMSSDSSEFIESDIEMDKEPFKLDHKNEAVEVMEVEPDLSLPDLKPHPKLIPKPTASLLAKKPVPAAKPLSANKESVKLAPMPKVTSKGSPQSILKTNSIPNKARKTLSPGSILSQRLLKPSPVAKRVPTSMMQNKHILVTQTTHPVQQAEPLKININVPPDSAGPATSMLNATAEKLADFMKQSVFSLISDLAKNSEDDLKTENANLKLQIETMKWQQQQTVAEITRNHEISLQELDVLVEENALRAKLECQKAASEELRKAVNEAKKKTWCAVCLAEASLYCCWNTSYCSFTCQKKHWYEHKSACKSKMTSQQSKSESGTFVNGPVSGNISKSVVYVATTTSPSQSNGTASINTANKKTAPQTLPPHAVFGTEITAALPQLLAVAPNPSGDKTNEGGLRTATHILMTPASSQMQVKLPAAIHHGALPATITARPVQTVAKPAAPAGATTTSQQVTPLFQFYKESTE